MSISQAARRYAGHGWGGVNKGGYGQVRWIFDDGTATKLAHRVAAFLASGEVVPLHQLHSCDNPPCCNPAHLRPGSIQENIADAVARGRTRRGSRNVQAKLTKVAVLEIRRRLRNGETTIALGRAFGVSQAAIWYIKVKRNWKYLVDDET